MDKKIACRRCGKEPHELQEYIDQVKHDDFDTPEQVVVEIEGTYNEETGAFWCTPCYVAVGMPLGKA